MLAFKSEMKHMTRHLICHPNHLACECICKRDLSGYAVDYVSGNWDKTLWEWYHRDAMDDLSRMEDHVSDRVENEREWTWFCPRLVVSGG